jgi:hypothetical protein
MRTCVLVIVFLLTSAALPQEITPKAPKPAASASTAGPADLAHQLESKVRAEWDAFKNKDKKAYGDLLAEDFVAIETDGEGARNKIHAVNEIDKSALRNYTLFGFQVISSDPHVGLVTYEVSMQFPPQSTMRFLRVWVGELWVSHHGEWKARYHQETRVK